MRKLSALLIVCLLILTSLIGLVACSNPVYSVRFIVNGQIYASIETKGEETIHIPDPPTKNGYIFDGWYFDKNTWEQPFKEDSLLYLKVTEDINIYAKWVSEEHKHTASEWIVDKEPSCKDEGSKHTECIACGEILETAVIGTSDSHTLSDWITDKSPSCMSEGSKHKECTLCKKTIETAIIDKTADHISSAWIVDVEATGNKDGSKHRECTQCGKILETAIIDKTNEHVLSAWITDREPNCKNEGSKHRECTLCGKVIETATIDKTYDHVASDWITTKAATCNEDGSKYKKCQVCEKNLETQVINKTNDHVASDWITTKAATCNEDGSKYKKCQVCEKSLETQVINKTNDHVASDWITTKAATCNEDGSKYKKCQVCEKNLETQVINKTDDHHLTDWIIDKPATCGEEGAQHKNCTVCKATIVSEKINKTENHSIVNVPRVEPTDFEDGHTAGSYCSSCGKILEEQTVLPAKIQGTTVVSSSITVSGDTINGTVSNSTEMFSFPTNISVAKNAQYVVAKDVFCQQVIPSKTVTLNPGDNVFFLLVTNGSESKLYTVTIRRRPMYTVTFNANGGSPVSNQTVEENTVISAPSTTKPGYTFGGWSYDFTKPITSSITANASWTARTDIQYKVEYYLERLDKSFELKTTDTLKGTTDTMVSATVKSFDHFTYSASKSTVSGTVAANGSLVLKVYYLRNSYTVKSTNENQTAGSATTVNDKYTYGQQITLTASANPGYAFKGWFNGNTKVSSSTSFTFTASENVTYTARWEINSNTKYTVEFYLQNLNDNGYTKVSNETAVLYGTTGNTVNATVKQFNHFTFDSSKSTTTGAIKGDGSLVLKLYYSRNSYTLSNANTEGGSISVSGQYKYGTAAKTVTVTETFIGYSFTGWYSGSQCLSTSTTYTFTSEKNVEARFDPKKEMENFIFTSTATTCTITGIFNKNVVQIIVPDYVTSINSGSFAGCSSLSTITLPFVGNSVKSETSTNQYPLGYIFGSQQYTGSTMITQRYRGTNLNSDTSATYYIPNSLKVVKITGGEILYGAFYGCTTLTTVIIPDNITKISDKAFYGCSKLQSITIPSSVQTIGDSAFSECTSLQSIDIPDNVLSIGTGAFENCINITSVTLGTGLNHIGKEAFNGTSLTSAEFKNKDHWRIVSKLTDSGTVLKQAELTNKATAAKYLKSLYTGKYWLRPVQ